MKNIMLMGLCVLTLNTAFAACCSIEGVSEDLSVERDAVKPQPRKIVPMKIVEYRNVNVEESLNVLYVARPVFFGVPQSACFEPREKGFEMGQVETPSEKILDSFNCLHSLDSEGSLPVDPLFAQPQGLGFPSSLEKGDDVMQDDDETSTVPDVQDSFFANHGSFVKSENDD